MKKLMTGLVVAAALSACAPANPFEETAQGADQSAAASAAQQFPGTDVAGIATCVRDNATEGELAIMALGDARSQTVTAEVLARPATQECLRLSNVALPAAPAS